MANISKYITEAEYSCRCCGKLPPGLQTTPGVFRVLFDDFDEIRSRWGVPIIINSGYRCPEHNKAVKGGLMSAHMFGLALDLDITGDDVQRFIGLAKRVDPRLRIGWKQYGGKLVHIDTAYYIYPSPCDDFMEGVEW